MENDLAKVNEIYGLPEVDVMATGECSMELFGGKAKRKAKKAKRQANRANRQARRAKKKAARKTKRWEKRVARLEAKGKIDTKRYAKLMTKLGRGDELLADETAELESYEDELDEELLDQEEAAGEEFDEDEEYDVGTGSKLKQAMSKPAVGGIPTWAALTIGIGLTAALITTVAIAVKSNKGQKAQ